MKLPEFGVFSTQTLYLHYYSTNGEDRTRFLKRAAILFEKLVLIPLDIPYPGFIPLQLPLETKERYLSWLGPEDPRLQKNS
jgi:hypothetical protein